MNGLYEVSNIGTIRNNRRHILSPSVKWNGYVEVKLSKENKKKHFQIHRLVAEAFIDNPNKLPFVNHKNEIKFDNRVENLEWCDNSYNIRYSRERRKNER